MSQPITAPGRPPQWIALNKADAREQETIRIMLVNSTRAHQEPPKFPTTWTELRKMVETVYYAPREEVRFD